MLVQFRFELCRGTVLSRESIVYEEVEGINLRAGVDL